MSWKTLLTTLLLIPVRRKVFEQSNKNIRIVQLQNQTNNQSVGQKVCTIEHTVVWWLSGNILDCRAEGCSFESVHGHFTKCHFWRLLIRIHQIMENLLVYSSVYSKVILYKECLSYVSKKLATGCSASKYSVLYTFCTVFCTSVLLLLPRWKLADPRGEALKRKHF